VPHVVKDLVALVCPVLSLVGRVLCRGHQKCGIVLRHLSVINNDAPIKHGQIKYSIFNFMAVSFNS
jgi:hypothetical protein